MKPFISLRPLARKLWPEDPVNRAKWFRAVALVRSTTTGWHLDKNAEKDPRRARVLT